MSNQEAIVINGDEYCAQSHRKFRHVICAWIALLVLGVPLVGLAIEMTPWHEIKSFLETLVNALMNMGVTRVSEWVSGIQVALKQYGLGISTSVYAVYWFGTAVVGIAMLVSLAEHIRLYEIRKNLSEGASAPISLRIYDNMLLLWKFLFSMAVVLALAGLLVFPSPIDLVNSASFKTFYEAQVAVASILHLVLSGVALAIIGCVGIYVVSWALASIWTFFDPKTDQGTVQEDTH